MLKNCPQRRTCSAPFCPFDTKSLEDAIWYPDEPICRRQGMGKLLWTQNQKKIAKRAKRKDRYFTFRMLNRKIIIRSGIEGIDPDKEEGNQVKRWLKEHPVRERTEAQRRATKRMRNAPSGAGGQPPQEGQFDKKIIPEGADFEVRKERYGLAR